MRKAEDFPEPKDEVWDENWDILFWFRGILSQIVHNGYCYTRLDYNVAYREFDDMDIHGEQRQEWKRKLRVLEAAALAEMNKGA